MSRLQYSQEEYFLALQMFLEKSNKYTDRVLKENKKLTEKEKKEQDKIDDIIGDLDCYITYNIGKCKSCKAVGLINDGLEKEGNYYCNEDCIDEDYIVVNGEYEERKKFYEN